MRTALRTMSSTAQASASSSRRRRVVLNFDLNRTVLMSDAAGGRTMENTVNYLLSECTWGHVDPANPSNWVCVSTASSIAPPSATQPLITYKSFVDNLLPYRSLEDAKKNGATGAVEEVKAFNKSAKKQRTALQSGFTSADGPGKQVIGSFQEVMERLHFPEGPQRQAAKDLAVSMEPSRLQEAWSEGRYYLLPSFVNLLFFLAEQAPDEDVKLVFRTFGDDIPEVAKELDYLVDGRHPFCPGRQLPARFHLTPAGTSIGTFYRDGFESQGTALAVGTLTKVPFSSANQQDAKAIERFYESVGDVKPSAIVRGFDAVQQQIQAMLDEHSTIALRDYWEWWSAHAEAGEYGKLLLVDTSARSGDLAVFYDDHVEAHHAHIVDVRDVRTGQPVPFSQSKDHYLTRVEPFAAIVDPLYFTKMVQKLLA